MVNNKNNIISVKRHDFIHIEKEQKKKSKTLNADSKLTHSRSF